MGRIKNLQTDFEITLDEVTFLTETLSPKYNIDLTKVDKFYTIQEKTAYLEGLLDVLTIINNDKTR